MSQVIIAGDTSGTITLQAPAVSGSTTLTLPATTATLATLTTPSFATTIGVGGTTPSASGAGISFPATQSASSDANTLDDYEEGTWTPVMNTGSTYTNQIGKYTKIGNMVYVTYSITINAIGGANQKLLFGLPFTGANIGTVQAAPVCYWLNAATAFTYLVGYVENNSSNLTFAAGTTANTSISLNGPNVFANNTTLIGSFCYQAA